MKTMYHLEYEESEQTFADMYQLFYDSRSLYFYKLVVTIGGLLALAIQLSISKAAFSLPSIIKLLVLWALAYAVGYLTVKYLIRRIDSKSAKITAERNYKLRREQCGTDLRVMIDFYEDTFFVLFQDKKKEYSYKEVTRMLQSEQFFGLVVGGVYGKKEMVGFPAACIDAAEKEVFLQQLEGKCANVSKGFRKLWF